MSEAGGLIALVLAAAIGWAAWLVARRIVPGPAVAARWSATALVAAWLLTAGFWLLSPWRLFRLGPAIGFAIVAAAVAHAVLVAGRGGFQGPVADLAGDARRAGRVLAALFRRPAGWVLAALGAVAGLRLARAAAAPPLGWDGLTYHLLKAGRFVQDGGLVPEAAPAGWRVYEHLAPGGEVLWAWAMLPLHADTLVPLAEAAAWAAIPLAVYALARQLGATAARAALAAATVGALPAAVAQIGSGYVDTAAGAALLLGAVFVVRSWTAPETGRFEPVLAAAGLGLAIGIKLSVAPAAAVLAVLLAAGIWRRRTPMPRSPSSAKEGRFEARGRLLAACVAAAAVGAPSYLATWAATGSPLFPLGLRIAGREILPGLDAVVTGAGSRPVGAAEAVALALWRPTSEGAFIGLGLAVLPVAVLAIAALPRVLGDRRLRGVALGLAGVAIATAAAGFTGALEPVRTTLGAATGGRFFLAAPAVLAALGALARGRWATGAWCAAAGVALWQARPRGWVAEEAEPVAWVLALGVALAAVLIGLAVVARRWGTRRWRSGRSVVAILIAAFALAAGAATLDGLRERWRYPLWEAAARPQAPLFHLHRLHPVYAAAWSLWRDLDRPRPLRLAVTAGWDGRGHNWYRYPLLGRRLQNRVLYVPVTASGELVAYRDADRPAEAASVDAWLSRLLAARIDAVVSLAPRWTVEDAWARSAPELFRPCGVSRGDLHAVFCLDRERAAARLARPAPRAPSSP